VATLGGETRERYPDPSRPHDFIPRRRGADTACAVCGGLRSDPIHTLKPKPKRFMHAMTEAL